MADAKLQLRAARITDLASIARVWTSAFFDDEIIGQMMHPHRNKYPEDVYWFLLRGIRERFWDWRHQFIVVIVDEGSGEKIVGAADWRRLGKGGKKMELWRADPRKLSFQFTGWSKSNVERLMSRIGNLVIPILRTYHTLSLWVFPNRAADPSRSSFLDSAVANSEKYWTGNRAECWDLHVCGVHPDFQGKGVGKLLTLWGVQEASREGEDVVASVLCGEKNRGFYGKAGLKEQIGGSDNGIVLFTR
jgi:ribosomal protein S18 acetylase RimI-like enzyme